MPLSSYPLHCSTLHAAATASTAQQPSLRPPLPSTTSVPSSSPKIPAPQWSVHPQLAASCRLPPTSFYNACTQHQVVSVSLGHCLHQPASHLIILAHHCPLQYLPKWSVCPLSNLVSANCLRLQIHHLQIAPFRSTNAWCGLLAYTYKIVTWGSNYSTVCPPGLCAHYHPVSANCLCLQNRPTSSLCLVQGVILSLWASQSLLSRTTFKGNIARLISWKLAISFNARRQQMQAVRLKSKVYLHILIVYI
jgi:hypothetical protein